ncbi:MAG: PilZ domain-containing protein [Candidatus Acidiferrales bacterium]
MMSAAEITIGTSAEAGRFERRRNPRYPFMADVEIIDLESATTITARTSDFSRGGCYVDMLNPLPEDTLVRLRVTKWQQTFETQAKVVYSSVGMGMGLMFDAIEVAQRAIVERWLTQLCGAQA